MPPRSRRLLSERSGASAGSLAGAPRLPPPAFAFAFPAADIAGAPARERRLELACECLGLPPFGGGAVVTACGFAGFEMDAAWWTWGDWATRQPKFVAAQLSFLCLFLPFSLVLSS